MPLRDICLPYLFFAPGFHALRAALKNSFLSQYIAESYAVLVIPRILLTLAGIVNLCLVRKLCQVFLVDASLAGLYWVTAYPTWTFLTRSFSNTIETLLFSLVCMLLLDLNQCCTNIKFRNNASETVGGQQHMADKLHRKFKLCSMALGVVLCMGIFNRPTFGLFVFAPLMWWVDQLGSTQLKRKLVALTISLTGVGFLLAFAVMSVCNSLYYNPEFHQLLGDFHISVLQWNTDAVLQTGHSVLSALRIPPLNFIQYNLRAANLAEHGLHPWYTHFLLNFPLLLGPLALLFYWDMAVLLRNCRQKHFSDVLYAMVVLPVLSLSFFPHQEARFLLPVLPVAVVCAARSSVARWRSFKAITLLFNIVVFVLFGWLHQGGVVPALSALQARMKDISGNPAHYGAHIHVAAYATYMPPRHLLFTESSRIQLHVHDMIGAHNHPPTLQLRMEKLDSSCKKELLNCHFFILLPTTAVPDVKSISGWQLTEEAEFCPHVSMERLPTNVSLRTTEDLYELVLQLCLKVVSLKM